MAHAQYWVRLTFLGLMRRSPAPLTAPKDGPRGRPAETNNGASDEESENEEPVVPEPESAVVENANRAIAPEALTFLEHLNSHLLLRQFIVPH